MVSSKNLFYRLDNPEIMIDFYGSDSIKNTHHLKTIFLALILLSGAGARAQHANSEAAQVITLRLQPVSFIDLSAAGQPAKQADNKNGLPANSSVREIIVNKNLSSDAALPADALQQEGKDSYRNMVAYNTDQSQQVYTFSRR